MYVKKVIHQIEIAVESIQDMITHMGEEHLSWRPQPNKRTLGELADHLACVCEADLLISMEASEQEMSEYYAAVRMDSSEGRIARLKEGFEKLKQAYMQLGEEELREYTTSYWGVCYSRFEWLLQIFAHLVHHRGQLAAYLSQLSPELSFRLFE